MSLASKVMGAAALVALVATGVVGSQLIADGSGDTDDLAVRTIGTVDPRVASVPSSTPAQAAMAVSQRLFERSPVAVLTTEARRDDAIEAGRELGVPVLLDDRATPAELARLHATTVLTFGDTQDVVGATTTRPDVEASAEPVDAVVLLGIDDDLDVAAATAEIAGAEVVRTRAADPRSDSDLAARLADRPRAAVIAVGSQFPDDLTYPVTVLQRGVTQPGGGRLALPGRTYVTLRGRLGDPASGLLGADGLAGGLARLERAVPRHQAAARAVGARVTAHPALQVVADDVAELEPVVDAAAADDALVQIELPAGRGSLLSRAQKFEPVLRRPNVGVAVPTGPGITAAQVDALTTWLADLTRERGLPQKLVVLQPGAPGDAGRLRTVDTTRPELAFVLVVDAVGAAQSKIDAYAAASPARGVALGWLNDTDDDQPLFSINQTWRLAPDPKPSYVLYR